MQIYFCSITLSRYNKFKKCFNSRECKSY